MKQITKKLLKIIISLLSIIIFIMLILLMFDTKEDIAIDKYNFEQLEKVKNTLDGLDKYSYKFLNMKEYNAKFNQNIKPIKNCYYFSSFNGNEPYIFGFKLESFRYKIMYISNNYIYPKFDKYNYCTGSCSSYNPFKKELLETISNPCRD